jgi:hypothetical protein
MEVSRRQAGLRSASWSEPFCRSGLKISNFRAEGLGGCGRSDQDLGLFSSMHRGSKGVKFTGNRSGNFAKRGSQKALK